MKALTTGKVWPLQITPNHIYANLLHNPLVQMSKLLRDKPLVDIYTRQIEEGNNRGGLNRGVNSYTHLIPEQLQYLLEAFVHCELTGLQHQLRALGTLVV